MRGTGGRLPLAGAALLLMAGCATSEEWTTWKENPARKVSEIGEADAGRVRVARAA